MPHPLPPEIVDDLFRHRYARLVAGLCRVLGPAHLELAEDVVQEAMLRALRVWPTEGVPDEPHAWVFRVARNLSLDALRRQQLTNRVHDELQRWAEAEAATKSPEPNQDPEHIDDDTLRMLFLCAHPDVPADARVPLILKNVCGLGVPAIASALLKKEATIAQRLVRAKTKLQSGHAEFAMPTANELPQRTATVLQVLYLMFNEGYRAHAGDALIRSDLINEAVRLNSLLVEHEATRCPAAHALLALMLLLGARIPARTDAAGDLIPLAQQDRALWDRRWLTCGFHHFKLSISGLELTAYHCEAAIASNHAIAKTYADTDWQVILNEYDRLLTIAPSPVVQLNRAVAVGKVHGAKAGLQALEGLEHNQSLNDYFLLGAVTAQLHWQRGDYANATQALLRALNQPCSAPERRLLQQRLTACQNQQPPTPW